MKILSVFVDESGDFGTNSKYYLLSFVFHNQANKIEKKRKLAEPEKRIFGKDITKISLNQNIPRHKSVLIFKALKSVVNIQRIEVKDKEEKENNLDNKYGMAKPFNIILTSKKI